MLLSLLVLRSERARFSYEVSYAQMSKQIKNIHKMGGKIISITEVG
ncbi:MULTISPECIES: phycobilisome linker polypeptide [unclassified Microcoleus]